MHTKICMYVCMWTHTYICTNNMNDLLLCVNLIRNFLIIIKNKKNLPQQLKKTQRSKKRQRNECIGLR